MKFGEEERKEFEVFQQNRHKDVLVIRRPSDSQQGKKVTSKDVPASIRVSKNLPDTRKGTEVTLKRKSVPEVLVELEEVPVRRPTKPAQVYNKRRRTAEAVSESSEGTASVSPPPLAPAPVDPAISINSQEFEEYAISEASNSIVYKPSKIPTKVDTKLATIAVNQSQRIILNIGGTHFETCPNTLLSEPTSVLSRLIEDRGKTIQPYNKENVFTYFLDRDPKHFRTILNFLRNPNGELILPVTRFHLKEILAECEYYELESLGDAVRKRMNEI
ncbi:uncharacterized protein LOC117328354 [Pecten maximus]|uniref:uncharacterized protein LOC117328354 n=1 Tax=Pecten maximus TaxID=6579 RepID=UPI0014586B28|nr:uncharacterized protein LOC117328354 [Pecten maximus]